MYEFYNIVLRARGGAVEVGARYPLLKSSPTAGRFVTTIHAVPLAAADAAIERRYNYISERAQWHL